MAANKEVLDAVLRAQEDKNYFDALVESNRKFVTTCKSKALGGLQVRKVYRRPKRK